MSDSIGDREFPLLVNELANLDIGTVKSLVVQLGVSRGECSDVDYDPVKERRQKLLDCWLKVDESATWSKLVDALKTQAVDEHSLAEKIRVKYCDRPSPAQTAPSQRPPLIREPAIDDERRSSLQSRSSLETNSLPSPFSRVATSPLSSSIEETHSTNQKSNFSTSLQSKDSLETNASSFDTSSPFSPVITSSIEETPSADQKSNYCACKKCSYQGFLDGNICPCVGDLGTQTGLPFLYTEGMAKHDKDFMKARLLRETNDIKAKFSHLMKLIVKSLKDIQPGELVEFLCICIDEDVPTVRKTNSVPAFELENAKSIREILLKDLRPYYSFFNFSIIEHIITESELIPEDDPLNVNKQLQSYKMEFAEYCKRRVYECPPVHNERIQSCAIVHCKLEKDMDDSFTEESILIFKGDLVRIMGLNTCALDLVRVGQGCVELLWQMPKHLSQHIFPLLEGQETELHKLGVLEFFCQNYKYTASAFQLKIGMNQLAEELRCIESRLADQLTEKETTDKKFLWQFRKVVLTTNITSKQDDLRLVDGHWGEIINSKNIRTMLSRLNPFWDITNPTLLEELVKDFGDDEVQRKMRDYMSQLDALKSDEKRILDFQIASARREKTSLPNNFTHVLKIEVPREASELHFVEVEHYHNTLRDSGSFHQSALRFVLTQPSHELSTVLMWCIPTNALDITKEYIDEDVFLSSALPLESITLDDKPIQHFKDYKRGLRLITACRNQDMESLNRILESGVDPNSTNEEQTTPLATASKQGYTDIVVALLEAKADVNLPERDLTPLNLASYYGHLEVVKVLLGYGAHVDALDEDEHTPLHRACFEGHTEIVKLLIENGADCHRICDDGSSALHQAANNGHCETVKLLLTKCNIPINVLDYKGGTALHWVSYRGHVEVMKLLIDKQKGLINIQDNEGLSPLMIASNTGHVDAVKLLVKYMHRPKLNMQNKEGLTALMMASQHGNTKIVEVLVKAHADVNICENTVGWSAVFFAAKEGHLEDTKLLIKAGAKITLKDKNKVTALTLASVHGKQEVCTLLETYLPSKETLAPQLTNLIKQSGEKIKEGFNRIDNWLKSTVKKEEFYRQQQMKQKSEAQSSIQALSTY